MIDASASSVDLWHLDADYQVRSGLSFTTLRHSSNTHTCTPTGRHDALRANATLLEAHCWKQCPFLLSNVVRLRVDCNTEIDEAVPEYDVPYDLATQCKDLVSLMISRNVHVTLQRGIPPVCSPLDR